jgi:hypothetical protein
MAGTGLAVVAIVAVGSVTVTRIGGGHGSPSALSAPRSVHSPASGRLPAPGGTAQATATPDRPGLASPSAAGSAQSSPFGALATGCPASAACRMALTPPSVVDGIYEGQLPPAGTGRGRGGRCTGAERSPPCGPGVVAHRYYAASVPPGCDRPIIFDGRRWWAQPTSIPGPKGTVVHVWLRLAGDRSVEVVAPFGTATLTPVNGGPMKGCSPRRS